jgi:hypothetical protein
MFLPDNILLFYYVPRAAFLDNKSKEKNTGIVKRKYKLLFKHHKILDIYGFFVLTTTEDSGVKERTICIKQHDWEERIKGYLEYIGTDCSYIDVQRYEVLNKTDVVVKATDSGVGFTYAGKLLQLKFTELMDLVGRYTTSSTQKTDFAIRDMLRAIVTDQKAIDFVGKFKI